MDQKLNTDFTFEHPRPQSFSLPEPLMHYLLKTDSNPEVYHKLSKTCKYFYNQKQAMVVHGAIIKRDGILINYGLKYHMIPWYKLHSLKPKLWITKNLYTDIFGDHSSVSTFNLMKHLYRFDGHDLCLNDQLLTHGNFKALVSSNKLRSIRFESVNILGENDGNVPVEKLLEDLNHLKSIRICDVVSSPETSSALAKLPVFPNLSSIVLSFEDVMEPADFCAFILKNKHAWGFHFYFNVEVTPEFEEAFEVAVKQMEAENWKPDEIKPFIDYGFLKRRVNGFEEEFDAL